MSSRYFIPEIARYTVCPVFHDPFARYGHAPLRTRGDGSVERPADGIHIHLTDAV